MQPIISKFQKVHSDKFDYSKVVYTNAKTKVTVVCKSHGDFAVTPNNHLSGYGCPKCCGRGFTREEQLDRFISKANQIHNSAYDYSEVNITDKKLSIICPIHGMFHQTKIGHITNKSGCPQCGRTKAASRTRLSKDEFIQKAQSIHKNSYSYNKVDYSGSHKKVTITCHRHGDFSVTPANHWSKGIGCPSCFNSNPSKGEVKIYDWLTAREIPFESQKTFDGLHYRSNKGRLKYDFFVPHLNLLIEFDGEYHYSPISFSKLISAEDQLMLTQTRDRIKTEYAEKNGFRLLRIRFDEDIESKLCQTIL